MRGETHQAGEPLQFPASDALERHAQASSPVARAHGQSVHGAQDPDDAVTRDVEHCRRDDAIGLGEAVEVLDVGGDVGGALMLVLGFLLGFEVHGGFVGAWD